MKIKSAAYITLLLLLIAVSMNSVVLNKAITGLYNSVEQAPTVGDVYETYNAIYKEYIKKRCFMSLTVNHQDTSEIEICFAEILGAAKANDTDSLIISKSRLMRSLSHLRRLSGINFDSIL